MIDVEWTGTQVVVLLVGLLAFAGAAGWLLVRRLAATMPPARGSSVYEDVSGQVLSQMDAHRGLGGENSDERWDGKKRLESGETNAAL
jgi:hypothetical protein